MKYRGEHNGKGYPVEEVLPNVACEHLAVGSKNLICFQILIFLSPNTVSLGGQNLVHMYAKIVMCMFKECYCGVGMLTGLAVF